MKQRLRRYLLGTRFLEQLQEDHRVIGRLGNRHYLFNHAALLKKPVSAGFNAYEFSCYSQNGEDGLILHLVSRVGCNHHFMVEIGTEDGRECNSANLILNFGWHALLIEAASHLAKTGREYFKRHGAGDRVQIINEYVTPENINALLQKAGVPEEPDILSIDIDSFDYWVWQALEGYAPAIVVIEYNASFGPDRPVTIPADAFNDSDQIFHPYYHGASITALQRLGEKKGYRLVGCDSRGVNSFFVRKDLMIQAGLETVSPHEAFRKHFRRSRRKTVEEQFQFIGHLPLIKVD